MPEGPEVKLSADVIRPLIVNRPIITLGVTQNSRYDSSPPEGMRAFMDDVGSRPEPTTITEVNVKGKFMYWKFSNGWYLMNTFGMSGQWSPKEGAHPCFFMTFATQTAHEDQIYFNDPRHFGTIKFTNSTKELDKKLQELGWDPLAMPLDKNMRWLTFQLSKSKKSIAEVLMDQSVFSGVGNYIRAEALYLSKLSPWRQANKLSQDEIKTLGQAIVDVMQESYTHQGATIHTYKTAYGEEGKYSTLFKVYGQEKDPLGNKIIKQQTPDKRTIHWCPDIQV